MNEQICKCGEVMFQDTPHKYQCLNCNRLLFFSPYSGTKIWYIVEEVVKEKEVENGR